MLTSDSQPSCLPAPLQDAATAIKGKVARIEDSQRRINDVRSSIDKVGRKGFLGWNATIMQHMHRN